MTSPETGTFDQFVASVLPKLWRLLRHSGLPEADAEDLAAEALARAYAAWDRMEHAPYRDGWVLRTATNLLHDRHRRAQRRGKIVLGADVALPGFEIASLDRAAVREAVDRLPRRQREAVALRYWADLDIEEIAVAMHLSRTSVQTHLQRARATLGRELADDEGSER
jgi:RNA polymerase sigma factor (sigma-70 family)